MKKLTSLVLVLVLLFAVGTSVFASSITDTDTGNSQEVLASYEAGTEDKTVISVEINWNKMSFTYKGASEPVWDAANHQYIGQPSEACWAASDATISITNHSNTILQAAISYTPETAFSDISMHFTDEAPYIGSAYTDDREDADGNKQGTPCTVTVKAIPDGILPVDTVNNTKIGIITVKVTSDMDASTVVEAISEKIGIYGYRDASDLVRGDVYFASGTDVDGLVNLADAVLTACWAEDKTTAEKNVAVNSLITAFYSALEVTQ